MHVIVSIFQTRLFQQLSLHCFFSLRDLFFPICRKHAEQPKTAPYSTQSLGFRRTSRISSSLLPLSGACMYSQRASNGRDIKMLSMRAPGV